MKFQFASGTFVKCLAFCAFLISTQSFSQNLQMVKGIVLEESSKGTFKPLFGASVYWLGTVSGTSTDSSGYFNLPTIVGDSGAANKIIVRYLGYESDTITVSDMKSLKVVLASHEGKRLHEVTVEGRIPPSFMSLDAINTQVMTGKELMKAACCNLSESFETNPAVEVNYGDAVTGAKQIQMLGLSGNYTQMTQENLPGVRGIMSNYGLGFTPGPWVESIQVTKGVGSVANGYESMTGQINVELKKPDWNPRTREKLFVNAYFNSMGRLEMNVNTTQKLSKRWFVSHLLHANGLNNEVDFNKDGFMDLPTGKQFNGLQRWRYDDGKGVSAQFGFQAMQDIRTGGQMVEHKHNAAANPYQIDLQNRTLQGFGKIGYIFPSKKYKSIGLMMSFTDNVSDQKFGPTHYNAKQQTLYSNLIYQSIIGSTNLKFRVGASFRRDQYNENLLRTSEQGAAFGFSRIEIVPGAFGELTWNPVPRFTTVAGLRADQHNIFGTWITPRLHFKYDITEKSILRFSVGQGRRLANILAENSSLFASSRSFNFPMNNGSEGLYGVLKASNGINNFGSLQPERAWNFGLSLNHTFEIYNRKGNFTLDAYRTEFQNQVVVDLDQKATAVSFYNLAGKSFSNAVQAQVEYEIFRRFDVRMAYKWLDVQQTYHGQLLERPFVAHHRFFVNMAYKTRSKWTLDATLNWNGNKRIPSTSTNPEQFQFSGRSPQYFVVNAQVSKQIGKNLDFYLGGENLFDFRQTQLINQVENPYGAYFDASLVWGPVIGRMIYGGFRWTLR